MVIQCAIIFGCLALGELVVWLTGIKLPSSIIGMLILTLLLEVKAIKLRQVEGMANFLVKNLGFFFVPAAVSLMSVVPPYIIRRFGNKIDVRFNFIYNQLLEVSQKMTNFS